MAQRFQEQADEIAEILEKTGLDELELARELNLSPETMRKIANGYQPATFRTMQLIRLIAKERMTLHSQAIAEPHGTYGSEAQRELGFVERNASEETKAAVVSMIKAAAEVERAKLKGEPLIHARESQVVHASETKGSISQHMETAREGRKGKKKERRKKR